MSNLLKNDAKESGMWLRIVEATPIIFSEIRVDVVSLVKSPRHKENFFLACGVCANCRDLPSWLHADCFGSFRANVWVLLKDPLNSAWGVFIVLLDPLYYTLHFKSIFTSYRLHMKLSNLH